jgi:hypothetical protein
MLLRPCTSMCIYLYLYLYLYLYVHLCLYIYIPIPLCTSLSLHLYMYRYIHAYVHLVESWIADLFMVMKRGKHVSDCALEEVHIITHIYSIDC